MMLLREYYKKIVFILCGILVFYAAIYVDVILRARSAYLEGEKYMMFNREPQKKVEYFEELYKKEKLKLDKDLAKGKIDKQDYELKVELLEFNKKRQIEESSLKYAYIWYKTAVDLFSPPQSKWVRLSKEKVPVVREQWKKELEKKGFKVEDYMLDW